MVVEWFQVFFETFAILKNGVCEVLTPNRPTLVEILWLGDGTTSAKVNVGFDYQSSLAIYLISNDVLLKKMILRNHQHVPPSNRKKLSIQKFKGHNYFEAVRYVLITSRDPGRYRQNENKLMIIWPCLVLELCTILTLTLLGIRRFDKQSWNHVN